HFERPSLLYLRYNGCKSQSLLKLRKTGQLIYWKGARRSLHDEQNIPGLLNRRIDMKYATTITFYDVIQHIKAGEIPGFPLQADVRLLIITNFAIIEADLVDPDAAAQEINPEN